MSSVIIEDCLNKVGNRFQLVVIAAQRARQLSMGAAPKIESNSNKPTITALKEIASGAISANEIRALNAHTPFDTESKKIALEIGLNLED